MKDFQGPFPAPAKLNLMLRVVGRREDGYHLLQTAFRFIDRADALGFRVRGDGAITLEPELPGVPAEANLCVRAARLLQEASGCTLGADIRLEKRLPMGGGLGGGSSDAATVLLALNRLWGLQWSRARLLELAPGLGADVPVFVFGDNAFAEGIGERLTAVSLPPAWYVVLVPPVSVPTGEIFSAPELTRNSVPIKIAAFLDAPGNDLEPVVLRRYPEVAEQLDWLRQRAPAWLTGSGACVFAAFGSEREAREVVRHLPSGWRGFAARGLDGHPMKDFAV